MSSAPTSGPRAPPPPYAIASPALRPPPCRRTHPFRSRAAIQEWTTRSEQTRVIPGERQSPLREAAWRLYSSLYRMSSRKAIRAFAGFSMSAEHVSRRDLGARSSFSSPARYRSRHARSPSGICTSMPVLLRQSSVRPAMHRGFIDRTDDLHWIGTGSAHRSLGGSAGSDAGLIQLFHDRPLMLHSP